MRVTETESHEIILEYVDWISGELTHYQGTSRRTVYVAHTDSGEIGLGEAAGASGGDRPVHRQQPPFDWLGDETSLPIGTAMYDLMGKAAGVPVYKLFGQKHRSLGTGGELDGVDTPGAHCLAWRPRNRLH